VYLTDVERLLDRSTILIAAEFLLSKKEDLAQQLKINSGRIQQLLSAPDGLSTDELLWWFGMTYICPFDAGRDLPAAVDCIVSHTVLEHIPRHVLAKFFHDTKSCGLHSHGIDHTDHRAHRDRRLNYIDFLRYSDRTWRLLCINGQDYTNRLRHSDYVSMMHEADYEILQQRKYVHKGVLAEAGRMRLWGRYRNMSVDELATTYSHVVAKP
jgi:hypothetical protein